MSTSTSGKPSPSPSPSSTGTSGPNAPSAAWNLPQLKLTTVLKIFLSLALAAGLWFGIRGFYQHPLISLSAQYLTFFEGAPPADQIYTWNSNAGLYELETGLYFDNLTSRYYFEFEASQIMEERRTRGMPNPVMRAYKALLPVHEISWNLIIFLALLGVVPWEKIKRRWWMAIISFVILLNIQAGMLALNVFHGLNRVTAEKVQEIFIEKSTYAFLGKIVSGYSVVGALIVPLLLLFPMFLNLKEKKPKAAPQVEDTKVRPNSPCPCGSGKKFKKCCGT